MASSAVADPPAPRAATAVPAPALWVGLGWALCCLAMLWVFRADLHALAFRDPDDAMRLQQVRDWIGGQGFFDVSQHRVNPPLGGPMHWSRIVDLPIAALILLFRPLIGQAGAEVLACIAVPLLLLGALTAATYVAARRIAGRDGAILTVLLLLTAPSILVQFAPLRIDHHGWQILMAALALAGMVDPRPVRGGIVMGAALAVWLQISSEGLPYVAIFGAVLALAQWMRPGETARLVGFAGTLGAAATGLLVLLHGPTAPFATQCDTLSAAYIWPLVAFAAVTPLCHRLIGTGSVLRRFLIPAIGGGAAIIVFALVGGPCLTGDPFQALGQVAYKIWYVQVMEGRPIWEQDVPRMGSILLPPVAGLIGCLIAAWQGRADRDARDRWLLVALVLVGACAVAMMVMRALSVAHVLALPGMAWMILRLFRRVQASPSALVRVPGSIALVLLTPVGLCAVWIAATSPTDAGSGKAAAAADRCLSAPAVAALAPLPRGTIFAPMDMGPNILIRTGDSVIATGHHRNAAGITAVIEGFMAPPAKARAVIARLNGGKGADYVVTCPGLNEYRAYRKAAPKGLAAALARGEVPTWLRKLPDSGPIGVYRVVGVKASATPFMQ